jgi:glycosyltransferase involved in cell wall biosynthesis
MSWEPLVSVIMPTYNRKGIVSRAIQSVLDQSYTKIELHVIDDGSTDGTAESLEEFKNDPRFNYYYQNNRGQSAARNLGISKSNGEIIAFLDSDNYWKTDKLEYQLRFWDTNSGFEIIYSEGIGIDERGQETPKNNRQRHSGNILRKLLSSNFVTNNTALVLKKCFVEMGGFDESLRISEDYDLWLRFATRYRFLYYPRDVAFYRVEGDDRLSAQEAKCIAANFVILANLFEKYPKAVSAWKQRKAFGALYKWKIEEAWNRGAKPAFSEVSRSLSLTPLDSRGWRHLVKWFVIRTVK